MRLRPSSPLSGRPSGSRRGVLWRGRPREDMKGDMTRAPAADGPRLTKIRKGCVAAGRGSCLEGASALTLEGCTRVTVLFPVLA